MKPKRRTPPTRQRKQLAAALETIERTRKLLSEAKDAEIGLRLEAQTYRSLVLDAAERMEAADRVATGMWAVFVNQMCLALDLCLSSPTVVYTESGRAQILSHCRMLAEATRRSGRHPGLSRVEAAGLKLGSVQRGNT